jgi:hypothetical protein
MIEKIINALTKEELKEFATDNGWKEKVMTTTESPNYEIPNPVGAEDYLRDKFNAPIVEAYKVFKLKDAELELENRIKQAEDELQSARQSLSVDEILIQPLSRDDKVV